MRYDAPLGQLRRARVRRRQVGWGSVARRTVHTAGAADPLDGLGTVRARENLRRKMGKSPSELGSGMANGRLAWLEHGCHALCPRQKHDRNARTKIKLHVRVW